MPGGAMTCDGRTGQNVPSCGGVHPIQTRASRRVFPRTPAAKANRPDYATSERQDDERRLARARQARLSLPEASARSPSAAQRR